MNLVLVTMGVPGLGTVKIIHDLDNEHSREAMKLNESNKCCIYSIKPISLEEVDLFLQDSRIVDSR